MTATKVMQFVPFTQTYLVQYRVKDNAEDDVREVTLAGMGLVGGHWVAMYLNEQCQLVMLEADNVDVGSVIVDGRYAGRSVEQAERT